jgi:hypothetical protein
MQRSKFGAYSIILIVPDPVGAGYVDSLARPGGNATGFTTFEYGIGGKWLELLKEIAPGVTQAAVLRDPAISAPVRGAVVRTGSSANSKEPSCNARPDHTFGSPNLVLTMELSQRRNSSTRVALPTRGSSKLASGGGTTA